MGTKRALLISAFRLFVEKQKEDAYFEPLDSRPVAKQLWVYAQRVVQHFQWMERFRALFIANDIDPQDAMAAVSLSPTVRIRDELESRLLAVLGGQVGERSAASIANIFLGAIGYRCPLASPVTAVSDSDEYESYLRGLCELTAAEIDRHQSETTTVPDDEHPLEIERKACCRRCP